MDKNTIFLTAIIAFSMVTLANIISSLRLPPPWDTYVVVGAGIVVFAVIYNVWEQKARK